MKLENPEKVCVCTIGEASKETPFAIIQKSPEENRKESLNFTVATGGIPSYQKIPSSSYNYGMLMNVWILRIEEEDFVFYRVFFDTSNERLYYMGLKRGINTYKLMGRNTRIGSVFTVGNQAALIIHETQYRRSVCLFQPYNESVLTIGLPTSLGTTIHMEENYIADVSEGVKNLNLTVIRTDPYEYIPAIPVNIKANRRWPPVVAYFPYRRPLNGGYLIVVSTQKVCIFSANHFDISPLNDMDGLKISRKIVGLGISSWENPNGTQRHVFTIKSSSENVHEIDTNDLQ